MDFEISPDDRIGGRHKRAAAGQGGREAQGAQTTRRASASSPASVGGLVSTADEPPRRGRAPKAKKQPRGKKQRKPFSLWRLFGRLLYWLRRCGVVAAHLRRRLSSTTTGCRCRRRPPGRCRSGPANIRIVAADGQLISNRGKMGGEAVVARRAAAICAGGVHRHRRQALLPALRHRRHGPRAPWRSKASRPATSRAAPRR